MKKSLLLTTVATISAAIACNLKTTQSCGADAQQTAKSTCKSCCRNANGCAKTTDGKYIGKEAAIATALAHAGIERAAARDLKCELDRENGIMVYEVEFESGIYDYEYDIDAATGKILKSKKELD